jgi:hypothetical protein
MGTAVACLHFGDQVVNSTGLERVEEEAGEESVSAIA